MSAFCEQKVGLLAVAGRNGDADASPRRAPCWPSISHGALTARMRRSAMALISSGPATPADDHGELVAAEARRKIVVAHRVANATRDRLQHAVAGAMAERLR